MPLDRDESVDIVLRERNELAKLQDITGADLHDVIGEVDKVVLYLLEWNTFTEEWAECFRECVARRTTEIMQDILFFEVQ